MPVRPRTPLTLALLVLLAGCGGVEAGIAAYRDGRFGEARARFAAAAKSDGDGAVPEVHYDHALAALRDGALDEANSAAERARRAAAGDLAGHCDFLLGSVRFARCEIAAAQAASVEAEPFAYDVAISLARGARDAWRGASITRDDWPAARRNAERAQRMLDDLERRKAQAARDRRSAKEPGGGTEPASAPSPRPAPPIPPPPDDAAGEPGARGDEPSAARELTRDEVRRLLDLLAEKEKAKAAARRAHRAARSADVDRDW